jgi:hypothetical protein
MVELASEGRITNGEIQALAERVKERISVK